jgi:hypothetical protein
VLNLNYYISYGEKTNIFLFWLGIIFVSKLVQSGILRVVGSDKNINFWHDVWIGNASLIHQFPNLYANVKKYNVFLCQVWNDCSLNCLLLRGYLILLGGRKI